MHNVRSKSVPPVSSLFIQLTMRVISTRSFGYLIIPSIGYIFFTFSHQILMSVPLDNITVTFRRERYATTHMDPFCVTVVMVTVEKMVNIAKVMNRLV